MIFRYRPVLSADPSSGELTVILRPEIPIQLVGPQGSRQFRGLLDTGADNVMLPASVARSLGIPLTSSEHCDAVGFGGQDVPVSVGRVEFRLGTGSEQIRWQAEALFYELTDDTVLLGYSGFLEHFRITFDAPSGSIDLVQPDRAS